MKTHLSKYLRQLEQDKEPIEVCLREDPVAYLTSAKAADPISAGKRRIAQRLQSAGIEVTQWGVESSSPPGPGGASR